MVGITLSPDEIRAAPPEVRRWIEQEFAHAFGTQPARETDEGRAEHLVACTPSEAQAVYGLIRAAPPVVGVFFELGREGESVGRGGLQALRLPDMLRHSHLQSFEQLAACLETIHRAFRTVRRDDGAMLTAWDQRGYCLVASMTQQSIRDVWQQLVAGTLVQPDAPEDSPADPVQPPDQMQASARPPSAASYIGGALPGFVPLDGMPPPMPPAGV